MLLTSDLRQRPCWECGWGSPGSRRRSTLTSIRLQKVHPAAATFSLLLSLKNEIEGTPPTGLPSHDQTGRTREVSPILSASFWAKSPGGATEALGTGRPGPQQRLGATPRHQLSAATPAAPSLPRRARHHPPESPPGHPTRSARQQQGPVVKGEIFPRRPPKCPAEGRGCSRSAADSAGY